MTALNDGERVKPAYPIESVDNALTLLLMFGDVDPGKPVRVADASAKIGVARSTAHRLLAMLQYHGFVQQDPGTRAYVAGPALLRTGLAAIRKLDIRRQARPYLESLSAISGETAHLVQLQGNDVLFLDAVEGSHPVRVASRVGDVMPAHCTSVGKALLAEMRAEDVANRYPNEDLPGLTPRSIVSRSDLLSELDAVRERGYATSTGEAELGVGSVGVAIPHPDGRPVAALSLSAPTERLNKKVIKSMVDQCLQAARALAAGLQ